MRKEPASGGRWVLLASEGEEWAREEPRIPPIKPAGYPQSEDARSVGESWAKVLPLPLPSVPAAANQGHVITGPGNSALGLGAGLISDNRLSIIDFLQSQFPVFSARSVPSLAPKMPRSGSKKARQSGPAPLPPPTLSEHIDQLLGTVDDDVEMCACLAVSTSPEAQDAFCRRVRGIHIPPGFPQDALPANLFPQFMSWAGQIGSIVRPFSAPNIAAAKAYRTLQKNRQCWSKKDFIEAARLNPRAVDKTAFLKSIPRFAANLLQNPYPPKNAWIAESSSILDCNRQFIEKEPLHDIRDWRRPIQLLDTDKLALDVGATESAQVYDAVDGLLVGMVVRDVCKSEEAVSLVDDAIQRIVETRITSRVRNISFPNSICLTDEHISQERRCGVNSPLWPFCRTLICYGVRLGKKPSR